jgi:class 3 adenylate cyclase
MLRTSRARDQGRCLVVTPRTGTQRSSPSDTADRLRHDFEGRTGIHVGEGEQRADDIGGIAVHLAARVMGVARPGEIIVTSTVVESSTGGTFRFADRGVHLLKGLEQPRHLLAVDVRDR